MQLTSINSYYLTCGKSEGSTELNAFDGALLNAKIGNMNLLKVSSICPPHCNELIEITLKKGQLLPVAYAHLKSSDSGKLISSAVAIAFPKDKNECGVIMEFSMFGPKEYAEKKVREMAIEALELRKLELLEIKSISIEHCVKNCGCTFAAVVLHKEKHAR